MLLYQVGLKRNGGRMRRAIALLVALILILTMVGTSCLTALSVEAAVPYTVAAWILSALMSINMTFSDAGIISAMETNLGMSAVTATAAEIDSGLAAVSASTGVDIASLLATSADDALSAASAISAAGEAVPPALAAGEAATAGANIAAGIAATETSGAVVPAIAGTVLPLAGAVGLGVLGGILINHATNNLSYLARLSVNGTPSIYNDFLRKAYDSGNLTFPVLALVDYNNARMLYYRDAYPSYYTYGIHQASSDRFGLVQGYSPSTNKIVIMRVSPGTMADTGKVDISLQRLYSNGTLGSAVAPGYKAINLDVGESYEYDYELGTRYFPIAYIDMDKIEDATHYMRTGYIGTTRGNAYVDEDGLGLSNGLADHNLLPGLVDWDAYKDYVQSMTPGNADPTDLTQEEQGQKTADFIDQNRVENPATAPTVPEEGVTPDIDEPINVVPPDQPSPAPPESVDDTEIGDIADTIIPSTSILSKFPFCVPNDFYQFLTGLEAARAAPVFRWNWDFGRFGKYRAEVDLSPFDGVASIARQTELILFILGLGILTLTFFS